MPTALAEIDLTSPDVLGVDLHWRQWDALEALHLPTTEEQWAQVADERHPIDVLYGGGKGGGKSWFLCFFAYNYAMRVIDHFGLEPRVNVPHVGWFGRKQSTEFVGTTLETWKEMIPESCYELKAASEKHPRHILIAGCVAIDYGGLDTQMQLNKFNSAEYGFIGCDQAEETNRDEVSVLMASRRMTLRNKHTGEKEPLPFRAVWTANPRIGWLKEDFIDQTQEGKVFIPALYKDNPKLPAHYVKILEDSFSHRPDLLRAYRDGDWDALSGVDQIILMEWVTAAKTRHRQSPYVKRWVSIDPARFGDDSCVILGGENTEIIDGRVLPSCPEPQIVAEAEAMAERLAEGQDIRVPIIVEIVGVCGVADYLREHGRDVREWTPAAAAKETSDPERYYNLRAEAWSTVGRLMSSGVYDPNAGATFTLPRPDDVDLQGIWQSVCQQLCWPWYAFRGQRVLVAPKKDIKEAHSGVSPDYADAYVAAIYHLQFIAPLRYGYEVRRRQEPNPVMNRMGF